MKIAICDDEKIYRDLMESYIEAWAKERGRTAALFPFSNGEELLKSREENSYDVVLLDIQMPGIDGMSIARQLREAGDETCLLFITGYEEYMAEGYEVEAFRYLLKPVKKDKLFQCLDKAVKKDVMESYLLLTTVEGERVRVFQKDISYIEAFAHTVQIHFKGETAEVRCGIRALEEQLEGGRFVRCHRSYIAGLGFAARLKKTELLLDDGTAIPISRRLFPEVNRAFVSYYLREEQEV